MYIKPLVKDIYLYKAQASILEYKKNNCKFNEKKKSSLDAGENWILDLSEPWNNTIIEDIQER